MTRKRMGITLLCIGAFIQAIAFLMLFIVDPSIRTLTVCSGSFFAICFEIAGVLAFRPFQK